MNRFVTCMRALVIPVLAVILGVYVWPMRTVPAAFISSSVCLDMMPFSSYLYRVLDLLPPDKAMMLSKAELAKLPVGYLTQLKPSEAAQRWEKFRSAYGDRPLYALLSSRLKIPRRYEPGVSTISGQSVLATSGELNAEQRDFIAFLKRGEQLDPGNAVYNLRLADYYWSFSVIQRQGNILSSRPNNQQIPSGMSVGPNQIIRAPNYYEVANRQYFHAGLAEYDKALKKSLRLYQSELYEAAHRNLPKAVFVEQYMDRINTIYEVTPKLGDARRITTVSRLLAKQGETSKALHYLQSGPYLRMMTSDPGATDDVAWYAINRIVIMTAVRRGIMLKAGHTVEARRLSDEHRQLDQLSAQYRRYIYSLWPMEPIRLIGILLAQMGWLVMCLIMALLVAAALLRQLVWFGVSRITRRAATDTSTFRVPTFWVP